MKKTKRVKNVANKAAPVLKQKTLSEALLKEIVGGQIRVYCHSQCSVCQSHCGAQSHCTPDY